MLTHEAAVADAVAGSAASVAVAVAVAVAVRLTWLVLLALTKAPPKKGQAVEAA
jgi:hypothetical protein